MVRASFIALIIICSFNLATRDLAIFISGHNSDKLLQTSATHAPGFIFGTFDSGSSEGSMEGYVPEWNQPVGSRQVTVTPYVFIFCGELLNSISLDAFKP